MHGQPNPTLAYEQAVLERFSPSGPIADPDRDARFKSILDRYRKQLSGTLYDTPVQAERVQVKIAPAPEYAGIINFVQDYRDPQQMASARELIDQSRATLGDYLGRYQQMSGLPPRVIVAPQTNLPAFANGTVPAYSLSTTGVEAAAREFLQTNQGFLGLTPAAGTALTDSLRAPRALDQSVGVISAQTAKHAGICHVRFQQWQGRDDAALPVYGGRVTMHMATTVTAAGSRRPATVTNSYFPLPDREFGLTVSPERAKEVARQTVLAYLTRRELVERLDRYLEDINGNELNRCIDAFAETRSGALAVQEAVVQAAAQAVPDISAATLWPFWRICWNTAFRFRSYASPWPAAPAAGRDFARYGDAIAPWLKNLVVSEPFDPSTLALFEAPVAEEARPNLIEWVERQAAAAEALDCVRKLLVEATIFEHPEDVNDLLAGLWQTQDDQALADWQVAVARYEGSETFILPYAGTYYRAYLVEFLSPLRDDGWRVFVDAETDGRVIGPPERLPMHALNYFASATALLSAPPLPKTLSVAEVATIVAGLLEVAGLTSSSGSPANLDELNTLATAGGNLTNVQQEALNVAFHAWQTWRHFRDIGKMTWPPQPPAAGPVPKLTLKVGIDGAELTMGFVPSVTDFNGTITFQSDPGAHGLQSDDNRRVFAPSLDPEVVVHELAHGLMWLLDRSPFENRLDSVPFSRALIEGYAMYFAHSLLEREDPGQEVWARAAYRDGDWGKRWSLEIPAGAPPDLQDRKLGGLAAFAVPNFYPEQQTTGLPVYDVGMVWARALWDIREMLRKAQEAGEITTDGRDVADRLALESYLYVHGWNSSFEMAAEGLIDAAQKLLPEYGANEQHRMKIKGRISDLFAARGILAERGVQAIAQVAGLAAEQWVIGTDFGLRFTSDLTQPWQTWTELRFNNDALPGVVGVTRDGNTVYIATESGVYSWDSQAGGPVTALTNPSAAPPPPDKAQQEAMLSEGLLCVEVIGGDLYVGTQRSVWRRRGNVWQNLGTFGAPILGITGITPPASGSNPVPICLIRTPKELQWRVAQPTAVQPPPSWRQLRITGEDEKTLPWHTAIQVVGNNTLYVATSQQGVRPIQNLQYVLAGSGSLEGVLAAAIPTNQLDKRRILCLAAASATKMFAGTTAGLFECNPASNTGWLPVPGSPPGVITVLTRVATTLVAGTTSHGLLLRQETAPGTHVVTPVAMDT